MSHTTSKTSNNESLAAKFAVVRLKPGDNLLGLFQLLIHNGFGEVSFVNNLSETIFPAIGPKRVRTPTEPRKEESTIGSGSSVDVVVSSSNGTEKSRSPYIPSNGPAVDRYQPPPQPRAPSLLPIRTMPSAVEARMCPPPATVASLPQRKITPDSAVVIGNESIMLNRVKRNSFDLSLLPPQQSTTVSSSPSSTSASTFATVPSSGFLGLPTMPSLNTSAAAAAAAAAIAALSEATTPPYSLANFFNSTCGGGLPPQTVASMITPATNANMVPHHLLVVAAAAQQQRQAAGAVSASTSLIPHSRSPPRGVHQQQPSFAPTAVVSQSNRPPLPPPHPQQRIQPQQAPSYQFHHQQQFQFNAAMQSRPSYPQIQQQQQQQQAKNPPTQKSPPAASPSSSSSNSSTQSIGHHHPNGVLSSTCAPMPPGCATTQLRQRGQRSYAEDPSLYVACRLCKNKIMGSRISNLTNHVRRHSSMKQFQCCYCDYTHNEMAKVRLHMLHNHKDKDSQPIDNLSPEMQASWDLLMKECFPEHCQQQQQHQQQQQASANSGSPTASGGGPGLGSNGTTVITSAIAHHLQLQCQQPTASAMSHLRGELSLQQITYDPSKHRRSESNGSLSPPQQIGPNLEMIQRAMAEMNNVSPASTTSTSSIASIHELITTPPAVSDQAQAQPRTPPQHQSTVAKCVECGLYVNAKLKARHIRQSHLQYLLPFVCSMCGFDHAEHSKLKLHICLKHDDDPMAQVITRDVAVYAEQLVPEYFEEQTRVPYDAYSNGLPPPPPASLSSPVRCGEPVTCGSIVKKEEPAAEVITNSESAIVCLHNEDAFDRSSSLIRCAVCRRGVRASRTMHHAVKHASEFASIFTCPVCTDYSTTSRRRMRAHLESKHVAQLDLKPLVSRRAPTKAALAIGGIAKRAMSRCFPTVASAKSIFRRVVRYGRSKSKKTTVRNRYSRIVGGRESAMAQPNGSRPPPSSSLVSGARNPVIKFEPKMELQSTVDLLDPIPVAPPTAATASPHTAASNPTDLYRMCPLCARWIRSDQLSVHLQSHVPSMGTAYRCNLCDYTSTDALLVRAHFLQEHHEKVAARAAVQQQQQPTTILAQSNSDGHRPMLMTYAPNNLCRSSSSTATAAADG